MAAIRDLFENIPGVPKLETFLHLFTMFYSFIIVHVQPHLVSFSPNSVVTLGVLTVLRPGV